MPRTPLGGETGNVKNLCFSTVVNEAYQEYIPLFVLYALRAYPQSEVLIHFQGSLHPIVSECLESLESEGRFHIEPILVEIPPENVQALKALRYLIYADSFADFEYVYIGDIDLVIVAEEVDLVSHHAAQCAASGLPYSNRVRTGTKRLTGLHFVRSKDYFAPLRPLMKKNLDRIVRNEFEGSNEELLYEMMRDCFGLPPRSNKRPHHGIHLRAWKAGPTRISDMEPDLQSSTRKYAEAFLTAARDPLCQQILQRLGEIPGRNGGGEIDAAKPPIAVEQFRHAVLACEELKTDRPDP